LKTAEVKVYGVPPGKARREYLAVLLDL